MTRQSKQKFIDFWPFWRGGIYALGVPLFIIGFFLSIATDDAFGEIMCILGFAAIIICTVLYFNFRSELSHSTYGELTVSYGPYSITPQAYIDALNQAVAEKEDSRFWALPAFTASGEPIDIRDGAMTLTLTAAQNGRLSKIEWAWDGAAKDVGMSLALYTSVTFEMISIKETPAIARQLDMVNTSFDAYETAATANRSRLTYSATQGARFSRLTIQPDH